MESTLWVGEGRLAFLDEECPHDRHYRIRVSNISASWRESILCEKRAFLKHFKPLHKLKPSEKANIENELRHLNSEINMYNLQLWEGRVTVANAAERIGHLKDLRTKLERNLIMKLRNKY